MSKFFLVFIYLFQERERGQRESQAGLDVGPSPTSMRSWPEPKSRVWRLSNWATQVPLETFLLKFIYLFWERERDRICKRGSGREEGYRESQAGSTLPVQSQMQSLNSGTMRSWPEPKSRAPSLLKSWTFNQVSHPGIPKLITKKATT